MRKDLVEEARDVLEGRVALHASHTVDYGDFGTPTFWE